MKKKIDYLTICIVNLKISYYLVFTFLTFPLLAPFSRLDISCHRKIKYTIIEFDYNL